jgi:hypothetical protein
MQLSESITVDVDPSAGAWLRESRQTHGRFWRVRSTRERAIRDAIAQRADARSPRVQQGLFDRREARREDQRRDSDREALERAAARIDAADAGRDLTLTAATALLLLV